MKAVTTELSTSTFQRKKREGKLPWTKLFSESVQAFASPNISDRLRALYFLIQPILGEHDGYLLDFDNRPHTPSSLSRRLFGRGHIETDLRKLVRYGILDEQNGVIFCPFMVRDKGKNSNIAKCHDDLVTIPLGESRKSSDPVEYSRVVVGVPPSGEHSPTTTTSTKTGPEKKETGAWCAVPFSGLTETDLDQVRNKYPFNFDIIYDKFCKYHTKATTSKVDVKMLWGWFKREKLDDSSKANNNFDTKELGAVAEYRKNQRINSLPKLILSDDDDDYNGTIGSKKIGDEIISQFSYMPRMSKLRAHDWLCEKTKCEWNTNHCIENFECWFYQFEDGTGRVCGRDYETDEEIEIKIKEEAERKAKQTAREEAMRKEEVRKEELLRDQRLNPTF